VCYSLNLVGIPKSSSCSSSVSHLALSIPALGLLVILYTSALSFIYPNILDLLSSFYSYYKVILALNSSIVSFFLRLISRSLKLSYFLILVLTFQSLGRTLRSPSRSFRSIYLSLNLTTVYIADSLIYKEASYLLLVGILIHTPNSWSLRFFNPKLTSNLSLAPTLV